ncbi:MAG: 50S ribosomal protein L13 [bacterium]|nr:50S ribosomal protein L13 [bacterium]
MTTKQQKTYHAKPSEITHDWVLVDANGQTLGRLASRVASIIRGKEKANFTPSADTGDFVIVINAEKIKVTGKKFDQKVYYRHSGYPGGLTATTYKQMMAKNPAEIIEKAVWGMVPHNSLGRKIIKKLKVYVGAEHPHQAQNPTPVTLQKE